MEDSKRNSYLKELHLEIVAYVDSLSESSLAMLDKEISSKKHVDVITDAVDTVEMLMVAKTTRDFSTMESDLLEYLCSEDVDANSFLAAILLKIGK